MMSNRLPAVRSDVGGDTPELRRLFYGMMAESGSDDFNVSKARGAFERGIKHDALLLVAPGKPGTARRLSIV
jgi:hypothetical protein